MTANAIKNIFILADLKKDFSAVAGNNLLLAKQLWAHVMKQTDAAAALRRAQPVPLAKRTTAEEASEIAQKLGAMVKGVMPSKAGYALRTTEEDKLTVKAALDLETSEVIGRQVMTAPIEDGEGYIVRNVHKEMNRAQLVTTLAK